MIRFLAATSTLWLGLATAHAPVTLAGKCTIAGKATLNAAAGYTANATTFAGDAQCWMERDADLTGNADGTKGAISLWIDFTGNDSAYQRIIQTSNERFRLIRWNDNFLRLTCQNSSDVEKVRLDSSATYLAASSWHWIAISWDNSVAGSAARFYVDGASVLSQVTYAQDGTSIDYTDIDWSIGDAVGGGIQELTACAAELWLNVTNYVDWSNSANRDKFYNSTTGKPVSLGSDGTTPGFGQPIIYLKDPFSTFTVNSGYGGNFVKKGTTAFTSCTAP